MHGGSRMMTKKKIESSRQVNDDKRQDEGRYDSFEIRREHIKSARGFDTEPRHSHNKN